MAKLPFSENPRLGIGVEIEIQLVDRDSGDLTPVGPAILRDLGAKSPSARIKSEIFQSMLEIDTPICSTAFEVGHSLRDSLALTRSIAQEFDSLVMMSGTHPFANYADRLLTPSGRYFTLLDRNQWITRRLQIFGLHVHLGMKSGDHAIAMNNALCHYLPTILALSASSPYWHAEDTGLASSRITFFEAIPTGGHPCLVENWEEFERLIEKLVRSRSITSMKDLWWDIRPNIEYGTIEIRIADCPPTIRETEAIVALIHTLSVFIDNELSAGRNFAPPPEWILRENKWRSSRHGVQCDLIVDSDGSSVPFHAVWAELKKATFPIYSELNYDSFFSFIDELIEKGPSYIRQRAHHSENLLSVVNHLVEECEADQPVW